MSAASLYIGGLAVMLFPKRAEPFRDRLGWLASMAGLAWLQYHVFNA